MPIGIILSVIVFQTLIIFVNLAVYATLAAAFGIGGPIMETLFVLLGLTFTAASLLSHWKKGRVVDWYYTASAYWFGLVNFLFLGGVVFYSVLNIFYHHVIYVAPALIGALSFGAFFLIDLYGTWNAGRAEITKITITIPGLPDFWKGKILAFVSDVHLGNIRQQAFAARVVKKIQAFSPHAVFIGGDLYDGTRCDEAALIAPFRDLHAPGGVNFVMGNHEYYLPDVPRALAAIRATGIRVLANEKIDIGGVDFVGVDYNSVKHAEDFKKVLGSIGVDRSKINILLKHEPNDLDIAERAGITMGFFGHTHRGQIFPLSLLTKQIYRGFDYGFKPHGSMKVYTSSGVGTWGPPLRIGTRSEIVIVQFA